MKEDSGHTQHQQPGDQSPGLNGRINQNSQFLSPGFFTPDDNGFNQAIFNQMGASGWHDVADGGQTISSDREMEHGAWTRSRPHGALSIASQASLCGGLQRDLAVSEEATVIGDLVTAFAQSGYKF